MARKSWLKVKVQGSSRGVATASQGEAGPPGSQAGLWQGNTGKLPSKPCVSWDGPVPWSLRAWVGMFW